jgi:single-strand DNA-binding protein
MTPPRTNAIERYAGDFLTGPPSLYRSSVPVDHHARSQFQVINIVGRLTRPPELKELPSGSSVCNLRLAVDGLAANRETGYIDVAAFGKPGEAAARVLDKGWLVSVSGRLEHRSWETDDGAKRQSYRVIGDVQFLAAPRSDSAEASEHSEPAAA